MSEFEQEEQHPFLENYKVDTKEYMDLVIDHMPQFKLITLQTIFIPLLVLIAGYIVSIIESPYITLFFFCLIMIPVLITARTKMKAILKWDYILQSKEKGIIDYNSIKENDTSKRNFIFVLNLLLVEVLIIGIPFYLWLLQESFTFTIFFVLSIFVFLLHGHKCELNIRFFFTALNSLLNEAKEEEFNNDDTK
ncbi:hypothetical protein M3603_15465 [Rummeliibacillus stabekisii]|uniref:hypothetical protein n=1 Tax=Rummeliibacillus stabekisii TaxID=241244 RepID=UPI00203D1E25|nr:hypothetical protein [Rummeliibacillus stabekisii]MCM3318016.1 hypothetical protein [Rummeliibacillus stabekisii]